MTYRDLVGPLLVAIGDDQSLPRGELSFALLNRNPDDLVILQYFRDGKLEARTTYATRRMLDWGLLRRQGDRVNITDLGRFTSGWMRQGNEFTPGTEDEIERLMRVAERRSSRRETAQRGSAERLVDFLFELRQLLLDTVDARDSPERLYPPLLQWIAQPRKGSPVSSAFVDVLSFGSRTAAALEQIPSALDSAASTLLAADPQVFELVGLTGSVLETKMDWFYHLSDRVLDSIRNGWRAARDSLRAALSMANSLLGSMGAALGVASLLLDPVRELKEMTETLVDDASATRGRLLVAM